jgi:uncharacterized protein YkwD
MLLVLAAAWLLVLVVVLALCRAAARADEQDERAGRKLARARAVGLVTATAAVAQLQPPAAHAAGCAARVGVTPAGLAGAIACRIEAERASDGLRTVHDDAALTRAARRYADNMATHDFFSHVSPQGGRLRDRIERSGWVSDRCSWDVGEMLAWSSGTLATPAWVVSAWMKSPEHRRILTGRRYAEIGVGVAPGAPTPTSSPAITAVALLGRHHCPE